MLAPGELGRLAAALDIEDFTSAGAAMPVRYNGSVARVNFGPLSAARVRRWLRDGKFDLIHIHEPITPSISLLALWAAEVPVVATFHTATPRSRSMQLAGGVLRAAIEKIDAGIAVSESARNVVVQHLGRDAVVIPNGIRFDDFATAALAAGPRRPPRAAGLVFLGRLDEPRKGLDVLLAAVPLIRRLGPISRSSSPVREPGRCRPVSATPAPITDEAKAALLASADFFVARIWPGRASASCFSRRWPAAFRSWPPIFHPSSTCSGRRRTNSDSAKSSRWATIARLPVRCSRCSTAPTRPRAARARQAARTMTGQVSAQPSSRSIARRCPPRPLDEPGAASDEHSGDPRPDDHRCVILAWRITWLATRVHRATARAERTWSALDAALVGRAQRAAELV